MAEFIELGSGGAWPDGDRNPPSHLITSDKGASLLVDCGSGSTGSMVRAGIQPRELSAVLLTHVHIDHCSDLAAIAFGAFLTGRDEPLTIYGPPGVSALVTALLENTYPFAAKMMESLRGVKLDVRSHELPENQNFEISSEFSVTPFIVKHGITTFGYRITTSSKVVGISGDTEPCDALIEIARSADLLIQDCAWTDEKGPRPGHCIPAQVGEIASLAKPRVVVLHHMFPPCSGHESEMIASVNEKFDGEVLVAFDQLRRTI